MAKSTFAYATYIRTTPDKLWSALTDPQSMRRYWFGMVFDCAWKQGSPWKMDFPDGRACDTGEILEIEPQKRMVIKWQNVWNPELKAEGPSRCTIELEPFGEAVKLSITHEIDLPQAKLMTAVSGAWPMIVANLKSLLETGELVLNGFPA